MNSRETIAASRCALWACAFILGLFLTCGNAGAQSLKATPEQFDFGTVPEGETAAVTATVQNVGNTVVEITNVRTS